MTRALFLPDLIQLVAGADQMPGAADIWSAEAALELHLLQLDFRHALAGRRRPRERAHWLLLLGGGVEGAGAGGLLTVMLGGLMSMSGALTLMLMSGFAFVPPR